LTQRVTVRRYLHGMLDGLSCSLSQRHQTLVFYAWEPPRTPASMAPAVFLPWPPNGTYAVSPIPAVQTKACGVVIPRSVAFLAIEMRGPHESCSWEIF
jgi:hypothetical protein